MHPVEIDNVISQLTIVTDTRERDTERFRQRMDSFGKWERRKLDFGDYSAISFRDDGTEVSLINKVHIERKMDLTEISGNFCESGKACPDVVEWNKTHDERLRNRFEWELKRAQLANAKLYLVVENASWENAYSGKYRTHMNSKAFTATIQAYQARYNLHVLFVNERLSATLIKDILKYEMREVLRNEV